MLIEVMDLSCPNIEGDELYEAPPARLYLCVSSRGRTARHCLAFRQLDDRYRQECGESRIMHVLWDLRGSRGERLLRAERISQETAAAALITPPSGVVAARIWVDRNVRRIARSPVEVLICPEPHR